MSVSRSDQSGEEREVYLFGRVPGAVAHADEDDRQGIVGGLLSSSVLTTAVQDAELRQAEAYLDDGVLGLGLSLAVLAVRRHCWPTTEMC
jgi:hypothetical protein